MRAVHHVVAMAIRLWHTMAEIVKARPATAAGGEDAPLDRREWSARHPAPTDRRRAKIVRPATMEHGRSSHAMQRRRYAPTSTRVIVFHRPLRDCRATVHPEEIGAALPEASRETRVRPAGDHQRLGVVSSSYGTNASVASIHRLRRRRL